MFVQPQRRQGPCAGHRLGWVTMKSVEVELYGTGGRLRDGEAALPRLVGSRPRTPAREASHGQRPRPPKTCWPKLRHLRVELPAELLSSGEGVAAAPGQVVLAAASRCATCSGARARRPRAEGAGQRFDGAASAGFSKLTVDQVRSLPAGQCSTCSPGCTGSAAWSSTRTSSENAVKAPVARACFVLAREFGWTPAECAELTLGQVLLYLEMLGRERENGDGGAEP